MKFIVSLIESYYNCSSSTIIVNDGENSGQNILHFHAHVIPRFKGDFLENNTIYEKLRDFDEEYIYFFNCFFNNFFF